MKSEKAKGGPLIPQRPVFCAKREKGTGQRRLSRAFFDVEKDEGGRPVRALEKALITALRHNVQKLNEFDVI
ncbi:hypothetical protein EGR95_06920 [bacterium]|nr:hypothetical protein [bacterium]